MNLLAADPLHTPEVAAELEKIGLFDCAGDVGFTIKAMLCECCAEGDLHTAFGKGFCTGCCISCCLPGISHGLFRTSYMKQMGLKTEATDFFIGCFLPCCSMVQIKQQHTKYTVIGRNKMMAPAQQVIIVQNGAAAPQYAPPTAPAYPQ